MSVNVRVLRCRPDDVFRVIGNGWLFPSWVVGASRMREVDDAWPALGARLHHSFGVWPMLIDDSTVIEEFDPPRRIVLRAKGWPMGEARVTLDVKERGDSSVVRIHEEAIAGPGSLIPDALLDIPLFWRNRETLHRLAYLAEGMAPHEERPSTGEREIAGADDEKPDPDTETDTDTETGSTG